MRMILQTIAGGGSGFGISYWKGWMGCERRAWYLAQIVADYKKRGVPLPMSVKRALITGTVAHGFLEVYYKMAMKSVTNALKLNTLAVSFVDDAGDPLDIAEDARLEGERIFRAYRTVYPPEEIGTVVEVEQAYSGEDIEEAVQCTPFTFKPDMAIRLDKRDCKRLFKTRRIQVEPGYYLVDHKTDGGREWADEMFMAEVQFTAYQLAWQKRHRTKKLNGLLVNVLPKTKRPEFRTLVVPFPSIAKRDVLFTFLAEAQLRRQRALETYPIANITHCYGFEPCSFLKSCTRAA